MSMNAIQTKVFDAALLAAIAASDADGKEAALASALAPYAEQAKAAKTPADQMTVRREAYAFAVAGAFIGNRHKAGDRTFKKGASAGAMAIVTRKAALMAEGPTASKAEKMAANKPFNEAQGTAWEAAGLLAKRAMLRADIQPPNQRKPTATGDKAKPGKAKPGKAKPGAKKGARVAFSAANVAPNKFAKGAAGALPLAQNVAELMALVAQTVNGNADARVGDLGSAIGAAVEAVNAARKALVAEIEKAKDAAPKKPARKAKAA